MSGTSPTRSQRKMAVEMERVKQVDKAKGKGKQRSGERVGGVTLPPKYVCGAKRRDGSICQQQKGWGTNHPGIGRCKWHGGRLPTVEAQAVKDRAILMGAPKEINAVDAIIWCIQLSAGEVEWLSGQISTLDEKDWFENTILGKQMNLFVRTRQQAMDRLVSYSATAIKLGLAERAVRIAEMIGVSMGQCIKGILDDLELTEKQLARAPDIVRKHLIRMQSQSPVSQQDRLALTSAA